MMILMENSMFFVLNDHSLFYAPTFSWNVFYFLHYTKIHIMNFEGIIYAPSGTISPHNVYVSSSSLPAGKKTHHCRTSYVVAYINKLFICPIYGLFMHCFDA